MIIKKFREGLEKVVGIGKNIGKIIKPNREKILIASVLPLIFANNVEAGYLSVRCNSSFTSPSISISHVTGATEGWDNNGKDASFLEYPWTPTIDIYSKVDFSPYRLKKDARLPTSITTVNTEISGRGLTYPENVNLSFLFYYIAENNFSWKNIIGELYQRIEDGAGGYTYSLIGNYDIKNMVSSAKTIPILINNGETIGDEFFPSHKLDYKFFNHADLNRDKKVDGLDFAILAQNWGRTGIVKGSNPNDPNDYADIADVYDETGNLTSYGNGSVGPEDLEAFTSQWLWNADDPNTYSNLYLNPNAKTRIKLTPKIDGMNGINGINEINVANGTNEIKGRNVENVLSGKYLAGFQQDAIKRLDSGFRRNDNEKT